MEYAFQCLLDCKQTIIFVGMVKRADTWAHVKIASLEDTRRPRGSNPSARQVSSREAISRALPWFASFTIPEMNKGLIVKPRQPLFPGILKISSTLGLGTRNSWGKNASTNSGDACMKIGYNPRNPRASDAITARINEIRNAFHLYGEGNTSESIFFLIKIFPNKWKGLQGKRSPTASDLW